MFDPAIYRARRDRLKKDVGSGLILLLGNDEVGMNYAANTYHFRQDSTFLYFFAVDLPGLAALIDVDQNTETLFGDDLTVADIVWTGPQPTIADQARPAAIGATAPMAELGQRVADGGCAGPAGALPQALSRRTHAQDHGAARHQADDGAVVPVRAAAQGRRGPAEHQVGGGGGGDRAGHRRIAADVPDRDGCRQAGEARIRSGRRDHAGRQGQRLRPVVPDHLFRARRDAAQPQSRQPDAEGRRDGARFGRRDPEQVCERHHPHDSRRRDVHGAAAADLRDGAAGATGGHQGHQAGRAVQGRPSAGRAQLRDRPQGGRPHEGRRRRGGRRRRARAVLSRTVSAT